MNVAYNGVNGEDFKKLVDEIYDEIVTWKKNVFMIPTGKAGKSFISLLRFWLEEFNKDTSFKAIAMKVFMILPCLLLQKPSANSKSAEHTRKLEHRLQLWETGKFNDILQEGKLIQKRLTESKRRTPIETGKVFARLMLQGKVNAALRFLSDKGDNEVLPSNDETVAKLIKMHPPPANIHDNTLLNGPIQNVPVHYFDPIDEQSIEKAAMLTKGAGGVSQIDADHFRRILCSRHFKKQGKELREQIALFAKNISTKILDPSCLDAYVACRLIALDKNPGVRPIGIGEILRRIVGKAIGWVLNPDIQLAAGPLQVSTGMKGGAESAIHAMNKIFNSEGCDGVILVDASNAFNVLNRRVALHNIQIICPPLATAIINMYRKPACLFLAGGKVILSQEGTTQGDNLAMSFYGLAIKPLMEKLRSLIGGVSQVWLADDATGAGKISALKSWFDLIRSEGAKYGYHVNQDKTWMILKNRDLFEEAREVFKDTSIKFTLEGKRHLGAALGSTEFRKDYAGEKVKIWCDEIKKLSKLAETQPHAAFAAFIHGEQHKFTYFLRTIPGMEEYIKPLDEMITNTFLPALCGSSVSNAERDLMSLPIRSGGLGISILEEVASDAFNSSKEINASLIAIIVAQGDELPDEKIRREIITKSKKMKSERLMEKIEKVKTTIPPPTLRVLEQTEKPGASSWLTAMPSEEHGFNLNKSEFRDAVDLRYNRTIKGLPSKCPCGLKFDLTHALNCKKGGFITIRHNDIRDFEANLLGQVCNDVEVEPMLQPVSNEILPTSSAKSDEARLDVRARGFWRNGQNAFFDVRVTNPSSESLKNTTINNVLLKNEREKKRKYNSRIMDIEQGTFTPLVFTVFGGQSIECSIFHKNLADKIANKTGQQYSKVSNFIRCKLSYLIIKSALLCLRGSRSINSKSLTNIDDDYNLNSYIVNI